MPSLLRRAAHTLNEFLYESASHPRAMAREMATYARDAIGLQRKPPSGLRFETHSHSHFSDGPELAAAVDRLFDKHIHAWSLTDHENSSGFDALAKGAYDLNRNPASKRKYTIDVAPDKRSLLIRSADHTLIMLRSIEKMTDRGEIGIHAYAGALPQSIMPLKETIKRATDAGGFVVINHPYFWTGLGHHGDTCIEHALNAGAIAIEKNAAEIPPQIYSPVRAQRLAKQLTVPLLAGGDAHTLDMYARSYATFAHNEYSCALAENSRNPADAIKTLIKEDTFSNHLRYITPLQLMRFFKMDGA